MLGVSVSGYYAWKDRPPSTRALRHVWLASEITDIHDASAGTYGAMRVTAEINYGRGISVGHNQVELIMRRLGIQGLPKRRLPRGARLVKYDSLDLVRRRFTANAPDRLWMTDITEHPPGRGRSTAAQSSTPSQGWSWAGRSTAPRPRCWSLTRSGWQSNDATPAAIRSYIATGACNSLHGLLARRSETPVWHHRWEPSALHTTMQWWRRSGQGCRSSY